MNKKEINYNICILMDGNLLNPMEYLENTGYGWKCYSRTTDRIRAILINKQQKIATLVSDEPDTKNFDVIYVNRINEPNCQPISSIMDEIEDKSSSMVSIGIHQKPQTAPVGEHSGGSVDYYKIKIECPTTVEHPYIAECNDIIEALNLDFAEGNILKAIWRRAAEREHGLKKAFNTSERDAEKIVFFAERILAKEKKKNEQNKEMGR